MNQPPTFPDPDAVRAWVRKEPRRVLGQLSAQNREVLKAAVDEVPKEPYVGNLTAPKIAAILLAWHDERDG